MIQIGSVRIELVQPRERARNRPVVDFSIEQSGSSASSRNKSSRMLVIARTTRGATGLSFTNHRSTGADVRSVAPTHTRSLGPLPVAGRRGSSINAMKCAERTGWIRVRP